MSEQHQEGPRQIWLRNITGSTEVTDSGDPLATEYLRADLAVDRERRMAARIAEFEREMGRYNMNAGEADQRMGESKAMREALGFDPDADDVSPNDLRAALARRDKLVTADALDYAATMIRPCELSIEADRLRREAEGETVFAVVGGEIERRFVEDGAVGTDAWDDVFTERQRQVEQEGWTPEHDDQHENGELAWAAASYAIHAGEYRENQMACNAASGSPPNFAEWSIWPWPMGIGWKPSDRRRDLVKAGALILAEIERLDRREAEGVE